MTPAAPRVPGGFRMMGAFDPAPGEAGELVRRVSAGLAPAGLAVETAGSPVAACAYLAGLSPPIACRRRPDGGFTLLDGEVYGEDPLDPATSDYAGAAVQWDAERAELTLTRDRAGIVPLYWARRGAALLWATSPAALEAAGIERRVNPAALDFFLAAGFVPSPWTFVAGLHKLPPGHRLRWRGTGEPQVEATWTPRGRPKHALDPAERSARLTDLLLQAVARRIGPENRVGLLLSGGVDSILLLGLAAEKLGARVESYTFDYAGEAGALNETAPAAAAARHFGALHREIPYGPRDFADGFAAMVRDYGEPLTYGVHSYPLGAVVEAGTPALLVGSGPDGWQLYNTERIALAYAGVPRPLRALAERLPGQSAKLRTLHWCARTGLATTLATPLAGPDLRRRLRRFDPGEASFLEHFEPLLAGADPHDRLTYSSLHFYSAEAVIHWNTKWSRAYDLPIRHPYFDPQVVDFLLRLPRKGRDKAEFREVAAAFMPARFARAPKVYQALPVEAWFRSELKGFVTDQLAESRLRRSGLFDPATVTGLVADHLSGRASHHWLLLAIMSTLEWLEQGAA